MAVAKRQMFSHREGKKASWLMKRSSGSATKKKIVKAGCYKEEYVQPREGKKASWLMKRSSGSATKKIIVKAGCYKEAYVQPPGGKMSKLADEKELKDSH